MPSLRKYDALLPILLLLLTVVYFFRQLSGNSLYWGDIGLYFEPMLHYLRDELLRGTIPLWNPRVLCGAPYVGNPQTWPIYPSTLFLFLMPADRAISWMVALHVWLAGWGMTLFLRRSCGTSASAAMLGAVAFMFGGQLVSKEQFPNMVQAAAYLPWLLLAIDRLVRRPGASSGLILGAVLGFQLLAAHAQITLLSVYIALIFGLSKLTLSIIRERFAAVKRVPRLIRAVLLASVIAAGLSSAQVMPIAELLAHGFRQRLSFGVVNRFYLPPNELLNFTLPFLHGSPYFADFTARGNFWETCCYIGWMPVLLAFAAVTASVVFIRRRGAATMPAESSSNRREAETPRLAIWLWSTVFIVSTLMATGRWAHVYRLAYNVLPGFRSFHDPARCLLWSCTAVSILGAYGLDAVRRLVRRRYSKTVVHRLAVTLVAIAFVDLLAFGRTIYPLATPQQEAARIPHGIIDVVKADPVMASGQGRVLGPDSARSWQRFTVHKSFRQNVPGYYARWRETLTPNLAMDADLPDAFGYEPETRLDTQRVLGMIDSGYDVVSPTRARSVAATLSGVYGVRYIVTQRVISPETSIGLTPSGPTLSTVLAEPTIPLLGHETARAHIYLSRDTAWQPRARLTTDFVEVPDRWHAIKEYESYFGGSSSTVDVVRTTLVAGFVDGDIVRDPSPVAGRVKVVSPTPDETIVNVDASRPSLLVLADTLHPGWHATVDGVSTPILSADGFVRAVEIKKSGGHVVRFVYSPSSFFIGLYLTLFATMVLVGCVFASVRKKRYID